MTAQATDAIHDPERIAEIAALDLLSPEVATLLHDATDRAAEHFDLPTALVSIVLDEAQYFAADHGLTGWMAETRGTPVEWSFCQHTVINRDVVVVPDSNVDPRFVDSPLVRLDGVRCYAGAPMTTSRGFVIGSFCVSGTEVRSFSFDDIEYLKTIAADLVALLEARAGRTPAE